MDRLYGIRLKIQRAKQHIRDLDRRIRVFCNSEPYSLGAKEKPEISQTLLYVDTVNAVPDDLALVVGDAVHNLRSALDHLACQLVEVSGGESSLDTAFPVYDTAEKYKAALKGGKIKGMSIGAQKIVEQIQPYATRDNTLLHITGLDNADKHRLLVTVAIALKALRVANDSGQPIWFPDCPVPLVAGYEIVHVPSETYKRGGHDDFRLAIDIAFGRPEVVASKPILETLNSMADFVANLVSDFEGFLVDSENAL